MSKFLVTGTAGFIGFHLANALIQRGEEVVGLDNINDYYDVNLKYARLNEAGISIKDVIWKHFVQSRKHFGYRFIRQNLEDKDAIIQIFERERFDYVIHLAAQAGVRYSIYNPDVYIQSNIVGFMNILEACRQSKVKHLVYASSSSVYGNNINVPFSEDDNVDHPISLYAATKKSNELMASAYNHLYGINSIGLRFFTVYGPWGRPDMAVWKFSEAIMKEESINVFAEGKLLRDFTYIDDIVRGTMGIIFNTDLKASPSIMNIGNNHPVSVNELILLLEKIIGRKAHKIFLPMQPGDVRATYANIDKIKSYCGFTPEIPMQCGLRSFYQWFTKFMKLSKGN